MIRHGAAGWLAAGLLAAGAVGCGPGGNHDPARYGTVRVGWSTSASGFLPSQSAAVRRAVEALDVLGPDFVTTDDGSGGDRNVTLRFEPTGGFGCSVTIDRAAAMVTLLGDSCLEDEIVPHAVGYALGRWVGMGDVCGAAGEAPECSPVGLGPAVMNPSILATPAVAGPTALDLAEFVRTHP